MAEGAGEEIIEPIRPPERVVPEYYDEPPPRSKPSEQPGTPSPSSPDQPGVDDGRTPMDRLRDYWCNNTSPCVTIPENIPVLWPTPRLPAPRTP